MVQNSSGASSLKRFESYDNPCSCIGYPDAPSMRSLCRRIKVYALIFCQFYLHIKLPKIYFKPDKKLMRADFDE